MAALGAVDSGQQPRPRAPRAPSLSECSSFSPPTTVILLILLCFEGLLFFIFTSVMFGTQVHSICTDETVSGRPATTSAPGLGLGRCCWGPCLQARPGTPRPGPGVQGHWVFTLTQVFPLWGWCGR